MSCTRTPNRVALDGFPSKNLSNKSRGDHTASPYIVILDELTIRPKKLTIENVIGTEKSWGKSAADGVVARDAKSGAFLFHMHGLISPSCHE